MRIVVEVIKPNKQRYNTVGDWQFEGKEEEILHVRVTHLPDSTWRGEAAIAVHEIVEAILCKYTGVTGEEVDAFDMAYDAMEATCEPGDHPQSPYRHEHAIATVVERLMVEALGLNWAKYEAELLKIYERGERRKRTPIQFEEDAPRNPGSTAA